MIKDEDFGLARIKPEGAPIHPDEIMDTDMTPEQFDKWYDRQLKAYNEYFKDYPVLSGMKSGQP